VWQVPDRKGHRFRVAIRRVPNFELIQRWRDADYDPTDMPEPSDSVTTNVDTLPLLFPTLGEGPASMEVFPYAHPTKILLSYPIAAAGSRSIANGISAIRTGYRGSDHAFRYRIFDRDAPNGLERFLLNQADGGPLNPVSGLAMAALRVEPIPRNEAYHIKLFAGERLLTMNDHPFFYQYGLELTSSYRARFGTAAASPSQQGFSWASRLPAALGTRRPSMVAHPPSGSSQALTVTIPLSITGDHLLVDDARVAPDLLTSSTKVGMRADQIPDPAMGYRILYFQPPKNGQSAALAAGYLRIAEIYLPWNETYASLLAGMKKDRRKAFVDFVLYPIVKSFNTSAPVSAVVPPGHAPPGAVGIDYDPANPGAFSMSLTIDIPDTSVFPDPGNFVLQALRDGFSGRTLRFNQTGGAR
jgi:hypothetical protein